jgi:hypothetical protein
MFVSQPRLAEWSESLRCGGSWTNSSKKNWMDMNGHHGSITWPIVWLKHASVESTISQHNKPSPIYIPIFTTIYLLETIPKKRSIWSYDVWQLYPLQDLSQKCNQTAYEARWQIWGSWKNRRSDCQLTRVNWRSNGQANSMMSTKSGESISISRRKKRIVLSIYGGT